MTVRSSWLECGRLTAGWCTSAAHNLSHRLHYSLGVVRADRKGCAALTLFRLPTEKTGKIHESVTEIRADQHRDTAITVSHGHLGGKEFS